MISLLMKGPKKYPAGSLSSSIRTVSCALNPAEEPMRASHRPPGDLRYQWVEGSPVVVIRIRILHRDQSCIGRELLRTRQLVRPFTTQDASDAMAVARNLAIP